MDEEKEEKGVTFKDQLKKFAIKSLLGFQTVITYGLGRQLKIFDYLYKKAMNDETRDNITSVSFTPSELSEQLGLDAYYVDGWLHMAMECGLFEVEDAKKCMVRTAPHVYSILVDKEGMFFMGDNLLGFYFLAPLQDIMKMYFKTGETLDPKSIDGDVYETGARMSAREGIQVEQLFSNHLKDHKKVLRKGGAFLEVGCSYGFNLENWAKKYRKARFIGIDIDGKAIQGAKKMVKSNDWSDRVEVFHTTIKEYTVEGKELFDVIMLNQVLHEMDPDDEYRIKALNDLHALLKDDGVLIVGEHMVPGMFEEKEKFQLFEIMHKWFEVGIGAKFYSKDGFKRLISGTKFKPPELIQEGRDYAWVLRK